MLFEKKHVCNKDYWIEVFTPKKTIDKPELAKPQSIDGLVGMIIGDKFKRGESQRRCFEEVSKQQCY